MSQEVRIEDVNVYIDDLMAAKTQLMRLRYSPLVEMRMILNDDQKVGYDVAPLKRSTVK